ncbi:hypothetical protein Tco_1541010 [Tanacetum coccineum]
MKLVDENDQEQEEFSSVEDKAHRSVHLSSLKGTGPEEMPADAFVTFEKRDTKGRSVPPAFLKTVEFRGFGISDPQFVLGSCWILLFFVLLRRLDPHAQVETSTL